MIDAFSARTNQGELTGAELVHAEGEDGWIEICESAIFREEVPFRGDPRQAVHRRLLSEFGGHLSGFVITGWFVSGGGHEFPWWLGFWGMGLLAHFGRVLPSLISLFRDYRRGDRPEPGLAPRGVRPLGSAAPAAPAPAPTGIAGEVARIRALLEQRGGKECPQLVAEVDRLVAVIDEIERKAGDLEEQTSEKEREQLKRTESEARERLGRADLEQDRKLFGRQLEVVGDRLRTIDKALRVLERLRVRRDVAEHQLKQLRLDLSRDEATGLDVPELSSRLQYIRHEVDAGEEIDEILAGGR